MNYRGYLIQPDPQFPTIYTVALAGQGGRVPNKLNGRFTSRSDAMQVIDLYLDVDKGGSNGKTSAKS